jgi:tetratricopeptide (TPR) repeat protein
MKTRYQRTSQSGKPASGLTDAQITDISHFLRKQLNDSLRGSPLFTVQDIRTGDARAGAAFFNGAGKCTACHSATGDLAGARKNYEVLVKQHPHDPIVLNNLGWLVQKHDPNRALAMLTLANKIAPQSANFADTLGWLKYQRKDHQGALPLLQRAHDIDTTSAPISYPLALALDATGKRPRRSRCCSPPWRKIQI